MTWQRKTIELGREILQYLAEKDRVALDNEILQELAEKNYSIWQRQTEIVLNNEILQDLAEKVRRTCQGKTI